MRNNGRWRTMELLAQYLGQGAKQAEEAMEGEEFDPIEKVWFYKAAAVGFTGNDEM